MTEYNFSEWRSNNVDKLPDKDTSSFSASTSTASTSPVRTIFMKGFMREVYKEWADVQYGSRFKRFFPYLITAMQVEEIYSKTSHLNDIKLARLFKRQELMKDVMNKIGILNMLYIWFKLNNYMSRDGLANSIWESILRNGLLTAKQQELLLYIYKQIDQYLTGSSLRINPLYVKTGDQLKETIKVNSRRKVKLVIKQSEYTDLTTIKKDIKLYFKGVVEIQRLEYQLKVISQMR